MKQTADLGQNRTGIASHKDLAAAMQADTAGFGPSSKGNPHAHSGVREVYAKEGFEIGSVPSPTKLKDKAKTAVKAVVGVQPTLLMDKLGERLAFERTGTRLYEALISKHEAFGGFTGGPTRKDLVTLLNEEHRHFKMLVEVMESQGGDPTAMTPSADIAANAAMGVIQVINDPRTTLLQSLEAILIAELTDREGWNMLVELTAEAGMKDVSARFLEAERVEEQHLEKVRRWLAAGQNRKNGKTAKAPKKR